ncbi:MAG: PKD domain-containing protein [Candidatus Omnitrophota bacterium]
MMKMRLTALFARFVVCLALCTIAGYAGSVVWASPWADKNMTDPGTSIQYKHPKQGSFTGPFDYVADGTVRTPEPLPTTGRCNQFTFDATKSYDASGQKLTYFWNFGDGTASDKPVVVHLYSKAGDYTVTLTVKNETGAVCGNGVATTSVSANFPPVASATDQKGCVGETITFDGSASTASGPASYRWDFGDGTTGEGVRVTHAYQKEGQHRVVLTVDDGKKTECSVASVAVNAQIAPVASVVLNAPASSCVGKSTAFDAQASGGSLKYRWDFGDEASEVGGSRMTHIYRAGGTYVVSVSVDNGQGFPCSIATDTKRVVVHQPPVANAGDNLTCCVGREAVFDASKSTASSEAKLSYHWDFGDGTTSEDMQTSHAYQKSGNYRVVLTVKDDSGSECSTASDSFVANVNTKPEAVIEVR